LGKGTAEWHYIKESNLALKQKAIMGFADLSIAEIAEDYNTCVEQVCLLCDRLGISYTAPQTRLALEDAKAVILAILAAKEGLKK
jgi:hypothetical protein